MTIGRPAAFLGSSISTTALWASLRIPFRPPPFRPNADVLIGRQGHVHRAFEGAGLDGRAGLSMAPLGSTSPS